MRLLAVGDVCGKAGVRFLQKNLPALRKFYAADVCVVNGENTSDTGILPEEADALFCAGADVVTLGNHTFRRGKIEPTLETTPALIRPLNWGGATPGNGFFKVLLPSGRTLLVVNLIGRCGCDWNADNPFFAMDKLLKTEPHDLCVVDFHAEATSEKHALGWYLDGRVAALWGTHTHVQTADERILPKGTGFITDLGMTGVWDSVLGMRPESSIRMFTQAGASRYRVAEGKSRLEGCVFEVDETAKTCLSCERVRAF